MIKTNNAKALGLFQMCGLFLSDSFLIFVFQNLGLYFVFFKDLSQLLKLNKLLYGNFVVCWSLM